VSRTTLRQDHWKASFLRVWVAQDMSIPATIDLCVSQMADVSDAAQNYREVLGSTNPKEVAPVTKIEVPGIPGAQAFSVNGFHLAFLEFSKGSYVVTVETSLAPTFPTAGGPAVYAKAHIPLVTVATEQYLRLPG